MSNSSRINRFNKLGFKQINIHICQSIFCHDPSRIAKNLNSALTVVSSFLICNRTAKFDDNVFISCSSQCLLIQYYPISCNSAVRRKIRLKKQALDTATTKYLKLNSQYHYQTINFQKQPPEVFCKIGVFENFTKFTGKNLRQSLFLIKVFSYEIFEIFQNTYFYRTPLVAASKLY